jgi:hypothetical protein
MPYLKSLPERSTMGDLAKTFQAVFESLLPLTQTIMRGESPLSVQQREFLFAVCSGPAHRWPLLPRRPRRSS